MFYEVDTNALFDAEYKVEATFTKNDNTEVLVNGFFFSAFSDVDTDGFAVKSKNSKFVGKLPFDKADIKSVVVNGNSYLVKFGDFSQIYGQSLVLRRS